MPLVGPAALPHRRDVPADEDDGQRSDSCLPGEGGQSRARARRAAAVRGAANRLLAAEARPPLVEKGLDALAVIGGRAGDALKLGLVFERGLEVRLA